MKKTLCAILAAAAVGLTLVSCSEQPEEGYQIIESETCSFYFQYPNDWTEVEDYDSGLLAIELKGSADKARIVGHSFLRDETDIKTAGEYWEKEYLPMLQNMYSNIEVISVEPIMLKDYEQVCATYSKTVGDEVFECKTIIFLFNDGTLLPDAAVGTLTLTQLVEKDGNKIDHKDYSEVLKKCLESIEFKRSL